MRMGQLCITESNTDLVLYKLRGDVSVICKWFKNNYLKANCAKLHILTTFENVLQTDQ